MNHKIKEYLLLLIALLFGLIVAVVFAPKNNFFFGNFAYFWGPQAIIFLLIIVLRFRIGILTGCAFILAIFLLVFHSWVFSHDRPEALVWIFYLFSFPGAGVGAILAGFFCKRYSLNNFQSIVFSALATFIGLFISLCIIVQQA